MDTTLSAEVPVPKSDIKALYRAILERPDDDALRGIYADALEENGHQDVAEAIRFGLGNPNHLENCRISTVLPYWPMPEGDYDPYPNCVRRRGLIGEVWLNEADFLVRAADLFARHPVTRVVLVDRRPLDPRTEHRAVWLDDWPHDLSEFAGWDMAGVRNAAISGRLFLKMRQMLMDGQTMRVACLSRSTIRFRREQEATEALSATCVAYGREMAGLPALEVASV